MAIEFKRTTYAGHFPEIYGKCAVLPGGFKPVQDFAAGTVLYRGTPIQVDFDARTAAVCKTALVVAGGTAAAPRVAKGHYLAVGDTVAKHGGDGTASPTVTAIDATAEGYDTLALSAAIDGLADGDIIEEASPYTAADGDTAAVAAAAKYTPNAVLAANKEYDGKGLPTLDVAAKAWVIKPNVGFPVPASWLDCGFCLKGNHEIKFIKQ